MKVSDLLPIGSVVLLRDAAKRLMIIGVLQTDGEGKGQDYDYLGVPYPEGHIGEGYQFLFQHADIETIIFRGFEDEERTAFLHRLEEYYTKAK